MLKVKGIFLGYSCKSEACRCLNLSTHKIIESAHVKVDEFAEKTEEESKKKPEDYNRFVFSDTLLDTSVNRKTVSIEPNIATELQEVQTKLQGPESQYEGIEPIATEPEQPEPKDYRRFIFY